MTVSVQTIKQINRDIYAKQGKKDSFYRQTEYTLHFWDEVT